MQLIANVFDIYIFCQFFFTYGLKIHQKFNCSLILKIISMTVMPQTGLEFDLCGQNSDF